MSGLFHYYKVPRFREIAFLLWPLLFLKLALERETLRLLDRIHPTEVLEIGGGWGKFTRRMALLLPGARITSVDNEPRMTRVARRTVSMPNLVFETGDFYRMQGQTQCVVLFGLFVMLWPRERAMSRLFEITGQTALVTATGFTWFTRALILFHRLTTGADIHPIEPGDFARLALDAGFASCQIVPVHGFERSYIALLRKRAGHEEHET